MLRYSARQWSLCFFFLLPAINAFLVSSLSSHLHQRHSATPLHASVTVNSQNNEDQVHRLLSDMTGFFRFMVDEERQRFYYSCQQGKRIHQIHPIRDLAAAWDATKALQIMGSAAIMSDRSNSVLEAAILTTLRSYPLGPTDNGTGLMVKDLPEPSNIAHSALMILAFIGALRLSLLNPSDEVTVFLNGLTQGILSMQQENGAFATEFHNKDSFLQGIDFYPGEAMLALVEISQLSSNMPGIITTTTQESIVPSLLRALEFYSNYYRTQNPATNYNIWQIQAFARCPNPTPELHTFVTDMCNDIVSSKAWKYELARGRSFYPNLPTVEIACGLDALMDGIHLLNDHQIPELWLRQVQNAIDFLEWSLDQVPEEVRGGLGFGGVVVMEQRLDVTGHAISALTKWNGIRSNFV